MRKQNQIGIIFVVAAIASTLWITYVFLRVDYWIKSPPEKLAFSWIEDLKLLEQTSKLPKQWSEIREIRVRTDNSPVQDWITKIKTPIKINPNGRYKLDVFFIHWIENYRYGVLVEYKLVDLGTSNHQWELSRTFKLGIHY